MFMHGAIKIGISHMWQDLAWHGHGHGKLTYYLWFKIACFIPHFGSSPATWWTVESDQHQWSRCMHLFTVQTRTDKELVMSYAIIAHSLVWAACTCSHIQLQEYLVTEFTSPHANGGKFGVRPCPIISGSGVTHCLAADHFVKDLFASGFEKW